MATLYIYSQLLTMIHQYIYIFFTVQIVTICCSNYTLYEITAFNLHERRVLYTIYTKDNKVYFMNGISNEAAIPINVAVENECNHTFIMKLHAHDIEYEYFSEYYNMDLDLKTKQTFLKHNDISKEFFDWDNIVKWVDAQAKKNNNLQKIVIAKTYERRDIFILKINNEKKKPIVFIVGSEDGKDWTSSAVILNFINKLMQDGDTLLLKHYNFYFVPILNPDGFVYSKTSNRFWSKNRRKIFPPLPCLNDTTAIGVNIDRNWFFQKRTRLIDEECRGVYIGYEPLSQEETHTLSYVLNGLAVNMIAFINLKGFGKFITIPYAHKELSYNHDILMDILTSASTTVKNSYNVTYYVDTTNRFIYNFSNNMADWVKKKLNIPIVFTLYMEHQNDFLPKPEHIQPITQHFYTILNETLLIVKDIYGPLFNKQLNSYQIYIEITILSMLCTVIIAY